MATPSHVDLSVLWVPIMPETSGMDAAMEQAGKDASDKFGQATKDIGKPINDALDKVGEQAGKSMEEAGKKAKGSFSDSVKGFGKSIHDQFDKVEEKAKSAGKAAGKAFNDETVREIRETLGDELGPVISDRLEGPITNQLKKVAGEHWGKVIGQEVSKGIGDHLGDWIGGAGHTIQDAATAVGGLKTSFAELKQGNPDGLLKAIGDNADHLPGPLKDIYDKAKPLSDKFNDLKGGIKETTDNFQTFTNGAPRFAGAFEMIGKAAGPVAITLATIASLDKNFGGDLDKLLHGLQSHNWGEILKGGGGMMGNSLKDFTTLFGLAPMPWDRSQEHTTQKSFSFWPGFGHANDRLNNMLLPGGVGAAAPPATSTPNMSSPWANSPWFGVAKAESGGNPSTNTGNGYYGLYQFDQNTWNDFGGQDFAPRPDLASGDEQTAVANRVPPDQRPHRWPNTYKFFGKGGSGSSRGGGADAAMAGLAGGLNLDTIPVAAQKYANDCIDASARIILSHSGVNMTEDQLMGVIAPGGTIDSQAAGMNRLFPAGAWKAMAGSGGSPAAMFAAIKASIDNGTGSILNVAPGSSIAGRNFADGHFIAATGYNPDGTINLSDTARGTKYSVTAADAFQATRGRGIVAGTGSGPAAGGSGVAGQIPTGTKQDPHYVIPVDESGNSSRDSKSPFESQGSQLGQGLVNGVLQMFGIDGSVMGGKSPLDWGAVKLGGGLLNYGMGLMNRSGGAGPMGAPGMSAGGGGLLSGLGGLIPHPGPMVSAGAGAPSDRAAAGLAAAQGGGSTTYYNMPVNVTAANPSEWVTPAQFSNNSTLAKTATGTRYYSHSGGLPERK